MTSTRGQLAYHQDANGKAVAIVTANGTSCRERGRIDYGDNTSVPYSFVFVQAPKHGVGRFALTPSLMLPEVDSRSPR